jgi:hypothetical protein
MTARVTQIIRFAVVVAALLAGGAEGAVTLPNHEDRLR